MWRRPQEKGNNRVLSESEKFVAAQVAFTRKIRTYARNVLPHLSGHDRHYDLEDVEQELLVVLWKCVQTYHPDNGATFNTFAQRGFQNRLASLVRETTARKRTAVGGVVSIGVEAISDAVDELFQEDSAEDYAVALMSCVGRSRETGRQGRRSA